MKIKVRVHHQAVQEVTPTNEPPPLPLNKEIITKNAKPKKIIRKGS